VLNPTSAWSFGLTVTPSPDSVAHLTIRHDYAGWNLFQRSRDSVAWLERLGMTDADRPPCRIFATDGSQGRVRLFHPSSNILVFLPEVGPPEFLARCPG